MTQLRSYDAIVVGLGAMGSATLYHLARRGVRAVGLDQFSPGHTFGSSHGDSRIIRETYFEHPLYVPLVQRAHHLWRELEENTGKSLMKITGGLMIGPPEGMVVAGTLRSVREHGLPHEVLEADELRKRFPAFRLPDGAAAVLDPRAGYLDPEACTRSHLSAAVGAGAETRFNEPVVDWCADGEDVRVTTAAGEYIADRMILCAGPWTQKLANLPALKLTVERQSVFWFDSPAFPGYEPDGFPIYAYEFKSGTICYGFPALSRGMKASVMHDGQTVNDADHVDRQIGAAEVAPLRDALRPILPSLADSAVHETTVCLFTNTVDHDFVIDWHPLHPNVLISSPCSGHGFKFASAIGELQADLIVDGKTGFDLSPFAIAR
ncbi:MAG: N-methyl-L-tryptophan oxidase [Gemmatimonadaceae bacterium]